nr:MAG TPA: hypothetical protein [Caudoviricetes sp.]
MISACKFSISFPQQKSKEFRGFCGSLLAV